MGVVTVDTEAEAREDLRSFGKAWWLFLIAGIIWTWIGMIILSYDARSVAVIAVIVGFVVILAGVEEVVHAFMMEGWRWAHAALGVLFLIGGVACWAYPGQTFGTLAIFIGWFLLFRGTFEVIAAIASHGTPLWWLLLISGIIQIGIAVWAIGYPGRSAALLVLWAGIAAIMRGVGEIFMAFQVRHLTKEVA